MELIKYQDYTREDIHSILPDMSMGILCSEEESFPNAILEYFSHKVPVISSDVGGCKEIVKNKKNGILLKEIKTNLPAHLAFKTQIAINVLNIVRREQENKELLTKESKEILLNLLSNPQEANIKELADELGIEVQRIYKWRKAAQTTTLPKPERPIPDDTLEIKRLRKALKEKELELEILKKAVHIFSKSDGKSMDL